MGRWLEVADLIATFSEFIENLMGGLGALCALLRTRSRVIRWEHTAIREPLKLDLQYLLNLSPCQFLSNALLEGVLELKMSTRILFLHFFPMSCLGC